MRIVLSLGSGEIKADKAILIVSFGSTYQNTDNKTIEAMKRKMEKVFPGYEVRRACTSRIVCGKIHQRDGIKIETERESLERLREEGYAEVIIQPLHVIAGEEFEKVKEAAREFALKKVFQKLALGRPLLYYLGQEKMPDDYQAAIAAIAKQFPQVGRGEAVVLHGHDGVHPANSAYGVLQLKLTDAGYENVYVYTIKGYPGLGSVIKKLKENKIKKVTLMPLTLVAGFHIANDMAGEMPDSVKNILLGNGFEVDAYLHGLGENRLIQDIYIRHAQEAAEIVSSAPTSGYCPAGI